MQCDHENKKGIQGRLKVTMRIANCPIYLTGFYAYIAYPLTHANLSFRKKIHYPWQ